MFDDLLIEKILLFNPKARFINRQFMKTYSQHVFNGRRLCLEDILTAFYCLVHGSKVRVRHFNALISLNGHSREDNIKNFTDYTLRHLELLSDEDKMKLGANAKKICDEEDIESNSIRRYCKNSHRRIKTHRNAHLLFDDIILRTCRHTQQ